MTGAVDGRFRAAAVGYLAYGLVYYVGGLYLITQGVGVMGGRRGSLTFWAVAGLLPLLLIPFLLWARRRWFERWVVTRRDFARLVAIFLTFRALKVGETALNTDGAAVAAPWGGVLMTFQTGAALFLVVTLAALVLVARAAWAAEERGEAP
ncbi:MAG: hypothetical protein FJ027_05845 [Candidatus Rokubacteria bacterium]|nr:hypothetical protein [Candidatus Rokubacteria bacterium]